MATQSLKNKSPIWVSKSPFRMSKEI